MQTVWEIQRTMFAWDQINYTINCSPMFTPKKTKKKIKSKHIKKVRKM